MGRGFNKGIVGDCLQNTLNNNVRLHRTITAHVVMNSPTGQGFDAGTFACGVNSPFTTAQGTRIIPDMYIYPNGSTFRAPGEYGRTSASVSLRTYGNEPVYFCPDDLECFRQRPLFVPNIYRMFASGPSVQSSHAWAALRRRAANAGPYAGQYEYDWLDANVPIQPTTTSTTTPEPPGPPPYPTTTPAPEPPPCKIRDWIITQAPASPLWASLPQPFLAKDLWEEGGTFPPRASRLGGEAMMPWCCTLPARDSSGTVLGSYVGYGFSFVFSQATVSFPVRPYLPRDPNSNLPNPPYINPRNAMYQLELLVYAVSDSPGLASPCIGRKRWWMYSSAGQSGGFQWFEPYFSMCLGSFNSNWYFDVLFPYYSGGQEAIRFNLSDMTVLVGAA